MPCGLFGMLQHVYKDTESQMQKAIDRTRKLMQEAAKKLEFIEAAQYRDELLKLEDLMKEKWETV